MADTNKTALLGIDVGFSARRPTTGIAWCVGDEFGARKTHTDWERRRAVIPTGVEFTVVAVDGPLPPSDAPADIYRSCERTFVRGQFGARCRPGLSHIGYGRRLRTAALETALDARSLLSPPRAFPVLTSYPAPPSSRPFPTRSSGFSFPTTSTSPAGSRSARSSTGSTITPFDLERSTSFSSTLGGTGRSCWHRSTTSGTMNAAPRGSACSPPRSHMQASRKP